MRITPNYCKTTKPKNKNAKNPNKNSKNTKK